MADLCANNHTNKRLWTGVLVLRERLIIIKTKETIFIYLCVCLYIYACVFLYVHIFMVPFVLVPLSI